GGESLKESQLASSGRDSSMGGRGSLGSTSISARGSSCTSTALAFSSSNLCAAGKRRLSNDPTAPLYVLSALSRARPSLARCRLRSAIRLCSSRPSFAISRAFEAMDSCFQTCAMVSRSASRVEEDRLPAGQVDRDVGPQDAIRQLRDRLLVEVDVGAQSRELQRAAQLRLAPAAALCRRPQRAGQLRGLAAQLLLLDGEGAHLLGEPRRADVARLFQLADLLVHPAQ